VREFRARKKEQTTFARLMASPWVLLALLLVILVLFRGTWRVYMNYSQSKAELERVQEEYDRIQKRDRELDANIRKFKSQEGYDYEIRKRLDVSKPDEHVIQIINTPENGPANESRQ
jgi:cell division protein FtsB